MSSIFKININDLTGAVISGVIVAVLAYLGTLTSIYEVDYKQLLDIVVLTAVASLLKSLATDSNGKLGGIIKIK